MFLGSFLLVIIVNYLFLNLIRVVMIELVAVVLIWQFDFAKDNFTNVSENQIKNCGANYLYRITLFNEFIQQERMQRLAVNIHFRNSLERILNLNLLIFKKRGIHVNLSPVQVKKHQIDIVWLLTANLNDQNHMLLHLIFHLSILSSILLSLFELLNFFSDPFLCEH